MKFVYIGAGSPLFGYVTTRDILRSPLMKNGELCLVDINKERLDMQLSLAEKINSLLGSPCRLKAYTDYRRALPGTDFVIASISAGGYPAEMVDGSICEKYGVIQDEVETVGPGGISHGLRTIPPIVRFARDMEKKCPKAVMINYSNPMSSICFAVSRYTNIKIIGLCHELFHLKKALKLGGLDFIEKIKITAAGVNHFTWIAAARYKGKDFLSEFVRHMAKLKGIELSVDNYKLYGLPTVSTNLHVANFFSYVLGNRKLLKRYSLLGFRRRYRDIVVREQKAVKHVKELLNGEKKIQDEINNPSEDVAVPVSESMARDKMEEFTVNVPNKGYVNFLPEEAIVEVPARVGKKGIVTSGKITLPAAVTSHLAVHSRIQELVAKAAVEHHPEYAMQAFLLDPVCGISDDIFSMTKSLIRSQRIYIPELYKNMKKLRWSKGY